jgi:hypothetical protein
MDDSCKISDGCGIFLHDDKERCHTKNLEAAIGSNVMSCQEMSLEGQWTCIEHPIFMFFRKTRGYLIELTVRHDVRLCMFDTDDICYHIQNGGKLIYAKYERKCSMFIC